MALTFDYKRVPNSVTTEYWEHRDLRQGNRLSYQEVADKIGYEPPIEEIVLGGTSWFPHLHVVTDALIWVLGLFVGIPEINEKNAEKVFLRIRIYEKVWGPFLTGKPADSPYFTWEEVHSHVGLKTNGTLRTDAQYRKWIFEQLHARAEEDLKAEKDVDSASTEQPAA